MAPFTSESDPNKQIPLLVAVDGTQRAILSPVPCVPEVKAFIPTTLPVDADQPAAVPEAVWTEHIIS